MSDSGRNQAVIGAFVVGAVVLAVVGVIVFGSGKIFQEVDKFVLYFEGSVKGLKITLRIRYKQGDVSHSTGYLPCTEAISSACSSSLDFMSAVSINPLDSQGVP